MFVLLMGFRLGAVKALEKMEVSYLVWSEVPVKSKRVKGKIIIHKFAESEEVLSSYSSEFSKVTHIIASTEASVLVASHLRKKLDLKRNKDSVILRCTDKLAMKEYLFDKNIPMTEFCVARKTTAKEVASKLGFPVVAKERMSSGGRGVSFLKTEEEIEDYLKPGNYFEKKIDAKEGSVESLIQNGEIKFTNLTQYYKYGQCNIVPAIYKKSLQDKILELNQKVIKELKIKWGMTHLEYYYNSREELFFGEIALRPPGGYLMEALEMSYGENFWEHFVKLELGMELDDFPIASSFSSTIILHPGSGEVEAINGMETIESLNSIYKIKLKAKIGDRIEARLGVGEDVGYFFLRAKDALELMEDIESVFSNFNFVKKKSSFK